MASRVFRIFKTIPFPEGEELFSNVYRYSIPTAGTNFPIEDAEALITLLEQVEKAVHSESIGFVRAESAPVGALDGIGDTDLVVELTGTGSVLIPTSDRPVAPENVAMVQERVGPKRWLRKFLHTGSLQFAASPEDGISFSYDTGSNAWTQVENYAQDISPLQGSAGGISIDAVLEAGNGTASEGAFIADDRIRWHDMKY